MAKKLTKAKAREILHDKEVHGQPLTDKQRRFFGAIAGGAEPYKAENGIEGTMGGLTDKGFNFNPAWGGAWRNGGWLDKYQDGGTLQPPMAGANQTVPMAQTGTRQPIYTSNPRDPRLRNYQDSLSLYNRSKNKLKDIKLTEFDSPVYLKTGIDPSIILNKDYSFVNYRGYNTSGRFDDNMNPNNNFPRPKVKQTILPIAGIGVNSGSSMGGWYDIYKKPVQPVEYKRTLERPNLDVDLPEIEFEALPQPDVEYRSAAANPRMISETPTKYSYTYPSGNEQKTIYFPSKSSWKAFTEQYDGLSTEERAGSFSASPGTYSQLRRPNPAFGDLKFAMGGSLPGSVGFMYARTAGAAPSEGPYAKKTLPSAQNGAEMAFYQQGLDWRPKTISRNGGWLDKFDTPQAQDGDVLEYLKKTKSAPVVTKGKPLTGEQQKRITAETLNRQTQKNKPLTATNTRPIAEAKARKEQLDVVEKNKEADRRLQAERAAARKTREAVIGGDENATFTFPDGTTKSWKNMDWREQQYVSGKNLGSLNRGDWTDYINPLAMIGSMGEGLATSPYEARRTNSMLPYVTGVGAPLLTGALGGIGTKGSTAKFVENVVNPTPISLSGGIKNIKNTPNVNDFSKYLTSEQVGKGYSLMRDAEGTLVLRNDGKKVGNIELFNNPEIDAKGNKWGSINVDINLSHRGKGLSKPLYEAVLEESKNRGFKGIYSTDELLQSPQQTKAIRKYFPGKYSTDENLLKHINSVIDEDNAFAKELGQYNFTPRAKQVYLMESASLADGGVIKDNEGYWNPKNWGKPVEISSNKITMEGVLEPLLGVSDTGDTKMMYPGKNYTFSGTKVVEYPREHFRAEDGKSVNRADEYPLEKLDNLLNFTNYNKPKAKNGWLEKYK